MVDFPEEFVEAFAGDGADGEDFGAGGCGELFLNFGGAGQFAFGEGDNFRATAQIRRVQIQLVADHAVVLHRIGSIDRRWLHEMDQDAGAFDVPQEFVAEAHAGVRAFNQPRQIGQDEGAVGSDFDQTEIGIFGGEGVVGDLRTGARQAGQQGAFSGVGFSDETDVGNYFQFQEQQALFAFAAGGAFAGRTIGGGFERGVSFAPFSAAGGDNLVALARPDL